VRIPAGQTEEIFHFSFFNCHFSLKLNGGEVLEVNKNAAS
jgi:hypothetical protein